MDADVIVIGAGAAGLAAARELAARSMRAIVLEARDRAGGRVLSRATVRAAVPAELGAEFIHGPAPQTLTLLREIGNAAIDAGGESWTFGGGRLRRAPDDDDAAGIFDGSRSLAADESVERFLTRFSGDPAMRETVRSARAFVEGFDAADPALASARAIAHEWDSGVDSSIARPIGGYPPLFERLRNACFSAGVHTQFSTVVRRIAWRRGRVAIDVENATGGTRTLHARAAIVTLPIGVLRHRGDAAEVVFEPALPPQKRAALDAIEMGHVVKLALCFRTPFWERVHDGRYRDAGFFRGKGKPFGVYWTQLPVRSELIIAWAGGPNAVALRRRTHAEIVASALDEFGAFFGAPETAHREFEGSMMHDWARDPFARGAYSYVAVGGGDARTTLGLPLDGALFFAGEATADDGQGGTVNGALASGERAAREAVAALGAQDG